MTGLLRQQAECAFRSGKRLLAPLIGLPGVRLAGTTVKLAQQNSSVHAAVLSAIIETFAPDFIFPLMELAVEANALGRRTSVPLNEPPTVLPDGFELSELSALESVDVRADARALAYCETIRRTVELSPPSVTVGGYVTGPYTLAALIMGAEEAAIATKLRTGELQLLLRLARRTIDAYLRMLTDAGARAICILEPTAVMLGPAEFQACSADHVSVLRAACDRAGATSILHVCGNAMHLIDRMVETGVDGLSLDSAEAGVKLGQVLRRIPDTTVILGNISPTSTMLFGTPEQVSREVTDLGRLLQDFPNFILATGCDLPLETPLENIRAFMQAGRHLSRDGFGSP